MDDEDDDDDPAVDDAPDSAKKGKKTGATTGKNSKYKGEPGRGYALMIMPKVVIFR